MFAFPAYFRALFNKLINEQNRYKKGFHNQSNNLTASDVTRKYLQNKSWGWNIYDKENGFTLFIGFNNKKIIGCYINQINPIIYNNDSDSLINNSCINVVKKLF